MDPKKQKNGCLDYKANDVAHNCVLLLKSKPSVVVSSSPSLCKIEVLDSLNSRNRCLEILDAAGASSNYASKELFIYEDFSFLNLSYQESLWT